MIYQSFYNPYGNDGRKNPSGVRYFVKLICDECGHTSREIRIPYGHPVQRFKVRHVTDDLIDKLDVDGWIEVRIPYTPRHYCPPCAENFNPDRFKSPSVLLLTNPGRYVTLKE